MSILARVAQNGNTLVPSSTRQPLVERREAGVVTLCGEEHTRVGHPQTGTSTQFGKVDRQRVKALTDGDWVAGAVKSVVQSRQTAATAGGGAAGG